jgi:hypothetical protein
VSYWDVSNLSDDPDFRQRCTAALATEGHEQPEQQAFAWRWQYAGQPGFGDAYAYAILTGVPNPGRDEAVLTDAQILAATQALLNPPDESPVPDATWVRPRILTWLADHGATIGQAPTLSNAELLNLVADLLDTP